MKKKIIAVIATAMFALALTACSQASSLTSDTDPDGTAHIKANGAASGIVTCDMTVPDELDGICINHIVEKGSFHVKITDKTGTVVFDEDINDNIANIFDASPGTYQLEISAKDAAGFIDVIAADMEAQRQADATMPEIAMSTRPDATSDADTQKK